MRISSYEFGRIEISGKTYTSDVIVFADRVESSWWRKEGHRLSVDDLSSVIATKPELLVIGTGQSGVMKVPGSVIKALEDLGIETMVATTQRACEIFNEWVGKKKVVAALHLTC